MSDKKRIRERRNLPMFLVAFFIPVLSMIGVFAAKQIFPFGDNCFLRTDLYHQYAMFFSEFQDKLQNGGSLLYSWDIGAGTNFVALYGYYLASPFNWLTMLVAKEYLIEWLSVLCIGKIGLCSLAFTWYLSKRYEKESWVMPLFGFAYALSAYMAAYSWNIMWLDCLALAPLILRGIEVLVKENRPTFYCVTLGLCILTNYYISIMVCLFLVLYFLVVLVETPFEPAETSSGKPQSAAAYYGSRIFSFAFFSLVAGGLAGILLLPEVRNLSLTASGSTTFPKNLTNYFPVLEMLARHCVNVTVEIGLDHWPNLYCGCAVLFLVPLYFMDKEVSWYSKVPRGILLLFLLFCFSYNIPNYVWHGFHYPNSLPCRQSFLYTAVLLTMCCEATLNLRRTPSRQIARSFWIAALFLLICDQVIDVEDFKDYTFIVSFLFMGVFAMFAYMYRTGKAAKGLLVFLSFAVLTGELTMNTQITSITTVSRSGYWRDYESYQTLVAQMEEDNPLFYRADKDMTTRRSKDDGAWLLYPSASVFSSESSSGMTAFYKKFGMEGSTNAYAVQGMTPVTAGLMGVKYIFSTNDSLNTSIYSLYGSDGNIYAYENPYALPLGYAVSRGHYLATSDLAGNPVEVQNEFLYTISGVNAVYEEMAGAKEGNDYKLLASEDGFAYAYITANGVDSITAKIGDSTKSFSNVKRGFILDLGYVRKGTEITLSNKDKENVTAIVYHLNPEKLKEAMEALAAHPWVLSEKEDTHVSGSVTVTEDSMLLVTVPYEEGWTVTVDGVDALYEKWNGAMIAVPLSAGTHLVTFDYEPSGLRLGAMISAGSLILLLITIIAGRGRKRPRKYLKTPEEEAREALKSEIPEDELDHVITIDDLK